GEAFRPDRSRPKLGEGVADLLQHPLEDLEHVPKHLVLLAAVVLQVHLEQRDCAGELGREAVMQLARDPGPLARDRVLGGLLGRGRGGLGHLAAHRRRYDPISATTSGWRSQRSTRAYGRHSMRISSMAARSLAT